MATLLFRRLSQLLPTLIGVVTLVFFALALIPGDPARVMLGERATPEAVAKLRAEMGLDRPAWVQLWSYLKALARGDLGESFRTHEPISAELWRRFPATLELAASAMVLACMAALPLGVIGAAHPGSWASRVSTTIAFGGVSVPVFWLGLMLLWLLALKLGLLPVSGRSSLGMATGGPTGFLFLDALIGRRPAAVADAAAHLALPAATLAWAPTAALARMIRTTLTEALASDFARTARAKGAGWQTIVLRHAMANALGPVLIVAGLEFGRLLGGAVITETVFGWPGVGRWLYLSVASRDVRAVQGGALLVATSFLLVNMMTDLLHARLDPRLREA